MKNLNILNIYQLNIYQTLNFMFKANTNVTPIIFQQKFKKPYHKYPTSFSINNLTIPHVKLKTSKFCISVRGPTLWNTVLERNRSSPFKKQLKNKYKYTKTTKSLFSKQ